MTKAINQARASAPPEATWPMVEALLAQHPFDLTHLDAIPLPPVTIHRRRYLSSLRREDDLYAMENALVDNAQGHRIGYLSAVIEDCVLFVRAGGMTNHALTWVFDQGERTLRCLPASG